MLIIILFFLLVLFLVTLYAIYKLVNWISKYITKIKWAFTILIFLVLSLVIKKIFFTKMEFIPSKVYANLYIVENPVNGRKVLEKAILNKIKEHLNNQHGSGKKISCSDKTECVFLYECGGSTFGLFGDAGTSYFIDYQEDLGGFVTEELAMYQDYKIAEFNYTPCANDPTKFCGKLDYYHKGKIIKTGIFKFN